MDIKKIAYEKYQLQWMAEHGITIRDLNRVAVKWFNDQIVADWSDCTKDDTASYSSYLESHGFDGAIWSDYPKFLENEYLDKSYMEKLLNEVEFSEYKADRQVWERRNLCIPGNIVECYKRELYLKEHPEDTTMYLYKILAVSKHTETLEDMVVYQSLYKNEKGEYDVWTRPMNLFLAEVNHVKYPESTKTYRFYPYEGPQPSLEISRCLTLSTAHITEETRNLLQKKEGIMCTNPKFYIAVYDKDDFGWWVYVSEKVDSKEQDLPEDLRKCMELARDNGCIWLCLDADGPVVAGMEQFSW